VAVGCHFIESSLMLNIFSNNSPVDAQSLKQILNEIISPRLSKRGLVWNNHALWFTQPSNSVRQVFRYNKLKGETGTFIWGVCVDFIPTLSSNGLTFHRTDKSVTPLLFEWTDEYANSFFGGNISQGITTHWGHKEARRSITELLNKYEERINNWFDNASTIDNLIAIATRQVETGKSYNMHDPNPKLILAFLQRKTKQTNIALKTLNDLGLDENIKTLFVRQLNKIT
jgi:hypothetical protein